MSKLAGTSSHSDRAATRLARIVPATCLALSVAAGERDFRGTQFIGFTNFADFKKCVGERAGETILTSPELVAGVSWRELVPSWNADLDRDEYLQVEARGLYPSHPTKYYIMGRWSG